MSSKSSFAYGVLCQLFERLREGLSRGRDSDRLGAPEPDSERAKIDEMTVLVQLLGGFGLDLDGRPVDVASLPRRSRELVELLALAPRHRLSRDQVVDTLFGHLDPAAGAANLHKAASLVRSHVGDQRSVVLDGGRVELWPDAQVETDAERFEVRAEQALAGGDSRACQEAAAGYAGHLLPNERYEEWARAPRDHLGRLASELLRAGGEWARLAEVDPTDEEAHQHLMRAHAGAGNRAAVVRQFQRLGDALAGLGLRPSPETMGIYEELTRGPAATAPLSAPEPMVGRRVELARLRSLWREAGASRGGAVLVRGEAGIGKTCLAEALLAEAAAAGWTTLRGSGSRVEAAIPYAPVVEAVDRLLLDRPDLADRLPDAARDVLGRLSAAASRGHHDEPLARQQVVSAVARLVAAAAKERGVVLLFDDLHAADDDTVGLVHYLARAAVFQQVLVLAALRAGEESPAAAEACRELLDARRATEVELGPLSRDEAAALVGPEAADALWERAGGNPFQLRELAAGGADRAASAVAARLDRLDPHLRRALQRAAVVGEVVTADELAALAGLAQGEALPILDAALAAGVLDERDDGYRFRHGLVREALIDGLPAHRRAEAHRAAAGALAAISAPPARVAHHLLAGDRPAEALPRLVEAARSAMALGAYREGRRFVDQALAAGGPDPDLLALRADLAFACGDPAAPLVYAEAVAATPAEGRGPLLARQARAHVAAYDLPAAAAALAAASVDAPADRALRRLLEAQVAWMAGDLDTAERAAEEARATALAHGVMEVVFGSMTLLDLVLHQRGRWPGRVRADLLEAGGNPVLAAVVYDAHLCGAEAWLYGGRPYDEIKAFAHELAATARDSGATRGLAFAVTLLGEAELLSGELHEAEVHLTHGIGLHAEVLAPGGEALARQRLAEVLLAAGRASGAPELLTEALHLARSSPALSWHLVVRVYGTMVRAAPDPEAALAVVDEAEVAIAGGMVEACPPCSVALWLPAVVACAEAGQPERARGFLTQAEPFVAALWANGGWGAALEEARGHIARAEGDLAAARGCLDQAADRFAAIGQRLDARRCAEVATRLPPTHVALDLKGDREGSGKVRSVR